ncbi:hypothetical protein SDC9_199200 [bioreactor metagenome]|uniref:Uncharacterized protein n=1 Tax=bioreactor metagenome TaxID=1076179 RepID=A0A645IL35_9ZZZZ
MPHDHKVFPAVAAGLGDHHAAQRQCVCHHSRLLNHGQYNRLVFSNGDCVLIMRGQAPVFRFHRQPNIKIPLLDLRYVKHSNHAFAVTVAIPALTAALVPSTSATVIISPVVAAISLAPSHAVHAVSTSPTAGIIAP